MITEIYITGAIIYLALLFLYLGIRMHATKINEGDFINIVCPNVIGAVFWPLACVYLLGCGIGMLVSSYLDGKKRKQKAIDLVNAEREAIFKKD